VGEQVSANSLPSRFGRNTSAVFGLLKSINQAMNLRHVHGDSTIAGTASEWLTHELAQFYGRTG
jgi:hypothetical protein